MALSYDRKIQVKGRRMERLKQPLTDYNGRFQEFLSHELMVMKSESYPLKAGFLERVRKRHARPLDLHPNPDDEFCSPKIGPNPGIISKYQQQFLTSSVDRINASVNQYEITKPIEVQKIHPSGYMILNGHHRWAAALRAGVKKVRIHIVDLTQPEDLQRMLSSAKHDQRVSLNLDEIVFQDWKDCGYEKPLSFLKRRVYHERIRKGIPALCHFLIEQEYDTWVYTADYYSMQYIQMLLFHYHCPVHGIITGMSRKAPPGTDTAKKINSMLAEKYKKTLHIDNESLLISDASGNYREIPLPSSKQPWSACVMDALRKLGKEG